MLLNENGLSLFSSLTMICFCLKATVVTAHRFGFSVLAGELNKILDFIASKIYVVGVLIRTDNKSGRQSVRASDIHFD